MSYNYLFIDDLPVENLKSLANRLSSFGNITVIPIQVKEFDKIIEDIEENINNIDGIILDLRLDESPVEDKGIPIKFKAPALAQELRILASELEKDKRNIKDLPIVLCSTDENIKNIYKNENTSHDLFDMRFLKTDTDNFNKISMKLKCLVDGYNIISQNSKDLKTILNTDVSRLNPEFLNKLIYKEILFPHECSQTILKELIFTNGLLIDKNILISRFGFDVNESEGIDELIENIFHEAKYKGAFSDGWDRWWSYKVNDIFKSLTGKSIAQIDADERIEALIENTDYKKLKVAMPIKFNFSKRYWNYCIGYYKEKGELRPLDPLEGFKVSGKTPQSWQDHNYISFDAVMKRYGFIHGVKLHISEMERFEKKKDNFLRK